MTEDKAKEKWCPFARVSDKSDGPLMAANRWAGNAFSNSSCCIASECMAWQPQESADFKAYADREFKKTGIRVPCDSGYCGLASK